MEEIWDTYVAGEGEFWDFDMNNPTHRLEVKRACELIRNRSKPQHIRVGPYTQEQAFEIDASQDDYYDTQDTNRPLTNNEFNMYCR